MKRAATIPALSCAVVAICAPAALAAEPFSFLRTPTEQLAVPGYVGGTEITPEGYLYTGYAELVFRAGPGSRPWRQPLRTREGGRLPLFRSSITRSGVRYTLRVLAAPVAGAPLNVIRLEARNVTSRRATARFAAAVRHTGGAPRRRTGGRAFRFERPATPGRPGEYTQPGERFDPTWSYGFDGAAVTRDGRALYLSRPARGWKRARRLRERPGGAPAPETVFGLTSYRRRLAPGRRAALELAMPVAPVPPDSPLGRAAGAVTFSAERRASLERWRRLLRPAMRLELPERKVEDAFYAALADMTAVRYRTPAGDWVQPVNKLQYHAFWLRDAAAISNAYDRVGLHELAAENLEFFLRWQGSDGLFLSHIGQLDGFGYALFALGDHVVRTGDLEFGRRVLPSVGRAMRWLERARKRDRLGLLPPSDPNDNELIRGHLAGDDFWAVAGVTRAVELARALGADQEARRWADELRGLRASLASAAGAAAERNGGALPPAFDASGGQDWGNLWLSYPVPVYAPHDRLVDATLRRARKRFREGLATYLDGRSLHAYLGFRMLETELERGEQRRVVRGLYDALAHTTATHAGFEWGVRPYGRRSAGDNLTPHGWWAAEYVTLLRNMLVRERGDELVLLSALPPTWLRAGRRVRVGSAPTTQGRVSFSLVSGRSGATLRWRAGPGARLVWRLPDAARAVSGPGLRTGARELPLPGRTGELRVGWRLTRGPHDSYARTVRRLSAAYSRRAPGGRN